MNVNCVICSDFLTPTAEVYVTKCGHMFHYTCLVNWLERKKTCPHCRNSVTEKTILRVYFNIAADGVVEDVGTLVNKVENLQFQLTLNQKDININKSKVKSLTDTNADLRQEIKELENNIRTYESTVHAFKDQISFFKSKSKETDRLNTEIVKLKQSLKNLQNVELALGGTKDQVNEMIRNEHNVDSLAILAATLKKTLLDVERRKRELDTNNKRLQHDSIKLKRELSEMHTQNADLRKELHNLRTNFESEKKYLKNKISDLERQLPPKEIPDNNSECVILESPVNFNRTPRLTSSEQKLNKKRSIEDANAVAGTVNDSPYLSVKANSVTMDFSSSRLNLGSIHANSKQGYSIFKSSHHKMDEAKVKSKSEFYDGLGGSSKDDIYPSPKQAKLSMKRQMSSSTVSSSKLKKLAPIVTKGKVSEFLSQL